ncbi:MAG: MFS transporter [Nitrospirae bacterium]|nr:MFS transporter [Nitrospirota bacterium]MCL5978461.1 MFS transporter [Nitrospirota bacterium]
MNNGQGKNGQRFSALYVRDFRLFWLGQVISLSGTWMHSVAQSWLVYSLTKSPLYLGIVASLSSLPILLFTLFGGMVADRYPKRNILIITQIMSVIPALIIAVLADANIIAVWHVGITAFFLGTVNAFDVPARQAFLAELVGKADITNAIALNSAAFNGARIIGPVIAGFIIAGIGIPACFYLNAVSFVPVIFALSKIKAKGSIKAYQTGIFAGIADGWGFVKKERPVMHIMSLISVFSLFGIPYITLLPVLAGEILQVGAKGLSFLVASAGAGSLLAAMMIVFKGEIEKKEIYMPLSALIFSISIMGISFSENFYVSMIFIFFAGWGIVSFLATSNSFIQHAVPDFLRGRVMSLYTLVFLGFAPVGNSIIGIAADFFGTIISLKIFALMCIIGSIIFAKKFRSSRVQELGS